MMYKTQRWNSFLFIGLWILAYAVAWTATYWINASIQLYSYSLLLVSLLIALLPGMATAVAQKWLVKRAFDVEIEEWLRASFIGWLASALIYYTVFYVFRISIPALGTLAGPLFVFVPASIVQWWILRRYVGSAWLWILAAVVSAPVFTLISREMQIDAGFVSLTLGPLAQGTVTGLTMWWLFRAQLERDRKFAKAYQEQEVKRNPSIWDDAI